MADSIGKDDLDSYLHYLRTKNPHSWDLFASINEAEFLRAVEQALEKAIKQIEGGARLLRDMDERALAYFLVQVLSAASIPTFNEGYHNGHVDVTVKHPIGEKFCVLGECKIYSGYQRHCNGCEQLLKRYSSGRSQRTFCLEFFKKDGMYPHMEDLRKEMDRELPLKQCSPCGDHEIKGAFLSVHQHFTGSNVEILHICCNVFYPEA